MQEVLCRVDLSMLTVLLIAMCLQKLLMSESDGPTNGWLFVLSADVTVAWYSYIYPSSPKLLCC